MAQDLGGRGPVGAQGLEITAQRKIATPDQRYSAVAIALHWLIAAALLFQVALGWRTADAEGASHSFLLRAHRSVGIAILLLSLARLAWRLLRKQPSPATKAPALEHLASQAVHRGFYGLMIGLPLTGWALVSATHGRSTWTLFGAIPWPDLPFLGHYAPKVQDALASALSGTHSTLVWVMLGLLALHVAGALKHHLLARDRTLARMVPGIPPNRLVSPSLLLVPVVLAGATAVAFAPAAIPEPPPRPPVTQLAAADVYLDVVAPVLRRRCLACHDEDESRGGLSLASYADLTLGGNTGPAIVPGDVAHSELLRRITLTPDHDGYMPRDGRTPLTSDQVQVLRWWVSVGAPKVGAVGALRPSGDARTALLGALGLTAADAHPRDSLVDQPPPGLKEADPSLVLQLESQGFVVRPIVAGSPLVDVEFNAAHPVSDELLTLLAKIGPQIRGLNLRAAGVHDGHLKIIGAFANLARLRLEENDVSDAGLVHLVGLHKLTYLNLVGTRVTDNGLEALASMAGLRNAFVWNTAVTADRVARLRRDSPTLHIDSGNPALVD